MDIDPDKTYDWQCNRCNAVRTRFIGRCPNCGCPEFRLVEVEAVAKELVKADCPEYRSPLWLCQ